MLNIFASSNDVLENEKEDLFINFQKNNRPSGLSYIKDHTMDYLFEALKDDVLAANEETKIVIKSIEANVVDIEGKGSSKVGSVHYQAVILVDGIEEFIDEMWHFQYSGWNWKLAGIEQFAE